MLHFLRLTKFTVLSYFVSSSQSVMVDWLKSKSLKRYHVCPCLKIVTKIFLEKEQYKSAQQTCCTFVLHFNLPLCSKIKT